MSLDLPLQVRWQTVAAPTQWHSARVQVPTFRQPQPLQGQSTLQRVLLYVLPDDAMAAERYAEVFDGDSRRGIKSHRPAGQCCGPRAMWQRPAPPTAKAPTPCWLTDARRRRCQPRARTLRS
ncbi:hypothetical protein [Stenotrophomonas sp. NRRL B-14846]|uniref:hypothetical protein n=1 Tax=Stenotrophomonas sp. NRRL B-14846 TaxID=3162882 RepID=UPI003D2E613A